MYNIFLYKLSVLTKQTKNLTLPGTKGLGPKGKFLKIILNEKLIYTQIILSVLTVRMASSKTAKLAPAVTVVLAGVFLYDF